MKKSILVATLAVLFSGSVFAQESNGCKRIDLTGADGNAYYFNYCADQEFSAKTESKAIRSGDRALGNSILRAAKKGKVNEQVAKEALELKNLAAQIISRSDVCQTPAWAQSAVKQKYEAALAQVEDKAIRTGIEKSYKMTRAAELDVVEKSDEGDSEFCQSINLRDPSGKVVAAR